MCVLLRSTSPCVKSDTCGLRSEVPWEVVLHKLSMYKERMRMRGEGKRERHTERAGCMRLLRFGAVMHEEA